ncbi:hypothetical protein ACFT0E_32190, partial [Streptomyces sp. NPDC057052]
GGQPVQPFALQLGLGALHLLGRGALLGEAGQLLLDGRLDLGVQDHFARGDWPTGVREGLAELAKEFGEFGKGFGKDFGFGRGGAGSPERAGETEGPKTTAGPAEPAGGAGGAAEGPVHTETSADFPAGFEPSWAHEAPGDDPARDLDRLLDRFRDDIRDAARDHGVTADQLREARRHLSTAAAHIGAVLRTGKQ